ncbi:MAG: TraR/DksA family transcriptional regulator [Deltaproteobacteria bacterium]|nr:TraR/DksA family transcriptional regulator [Deltaproteobacteria bacterium]
MTTGKEKGGRKSARGKTPPKGGRGVPAKKGRPSGTGKGTKGKKWEGDFKAAFLQGLLVKKEELEESLERLRTSQKEYGGQLTAGDFIDEIDDAQREITTHKLYSLIERKNKEIRNINRLISRISKEEDFGICEECGKRIPRERLLVIPEAVLCVACQREVEKMDSRRGPAARPSGPFTGRKDMEWGADGADDEGDVMVEYQIGALPDMDVDEMETEDAGNAKEKQEEE